MALVPGRAPLPIEAIPDASFHTPARARPARPRGGRRPSPGDQQGAAPELLPLSSALLAKLPADWRELATHIKATDAEQQRFLKLSDVVFRQTVARLLTRIRPADAFVRTQIAADPSPAVRTALVQAIAADARWSALPETALLIEGVVARDPDPAVSLDGARSAAPPSHARAQRTPRRAAVGRGPRRC